MTNKERQAFIRRLERARAAVARGDTGCATEATKCWMCALRKRSGGGDFWKFTGPDADWSLNRPKSDTLALFDNSIAALKAEPPARLHGKED